MPSVTTNGCDGLHAASVPLSAPNAAPTAMPTRMAMGAGIASRISNAATTAARLMRDPTERSMPPETISRVMPQATIASTLDCRRTFLRLPTVRKTSLCVAVKAEMMRRTRPSATSAACSRSRPRRLASRSRPSAPPERAPVSTVVT